MWQEAEAMFIRVAQAYEVLSDPEARRQFDNSGQASPGGGSSAPEVCGVGERWRGGMSGGWVADGGGILISRSTQPMDR